ncbi:trk system potassium uptake protein TrkA [Idiomarina aquatica]|uniref:Trk system potassium uptake protein TrkA n=1 Tax=Idiomarina aquatica TaxID=1327752 RepID=A0A4R6P044_9GAMM|nr:TrkA family potassium uptake protein [Idiomarina aquatica]MAK71604.1 potassium transporter TrkA [Idiomarinaceae bacterium]TDP30741.1 trk system potassium uptake protein TrkA [Idiomarina aquatica]
MAQFGVIGLGRFGARTSLELLDLGHEVIGVDSDEKSVDALAEYLTHAAIADVTDEKALKELSLEECDVVLVAIGEDLQASLLCVLHLKSIGVKEIWAKATSKEHHQILSKLGVKRIIHPEEEMGIRVAQALNYPMVNEYMSLGHNWYCVEIDVNEDLNGKSIEDILPDDLEHFHLLLLKRRDEVTANPSTSVKLEGNETLVIAGSLKALKSMAPKLQ